MSEIRSRNRYAVWVLVLAVAVGIVMMLTWARPTPVAAAAAAAPSGQSDSELKASDQNNLKQLGIVCKMYANENKGQFPPLDPRPGRLILSQKAIYPEYLTDPSVLVNPALPNAPKTQQDVKVFPDDFFDDKSYWYIPYAVDDDVTGLAFVEAYREAAKAGKVLEGDIKLDPSKNERKLSAVFRTREGIERFFITDINQPAASAVIQSKLPIIIGRPGILPGAKGADVLFMDGHVEFMPYPSKFPMTERFIKALESLDNIK